MLLRSVQWWPGSKRAQKQAPGVWPCRRWVGYGKSLKRGGSPDPKKKPSHGKSPVGFRGKTLFQKRPWCFFLFFLQNFDVPKQSSFGPFFFPNLDFFFGTFQAPRCPRLSFRCSCTNFPMAFHGKVDMSVSNGGWIRCLPSKDPI